MTAQDSDGPDFSGSGPVEYHPAESRPQTAAQQVLSQEEAGLLGIPGVTSVGLGLDPAGGETLTIGVTDAGVASRLPAEIGGLPVTVVFTGPVDALPRR